MKKLVMKLDLPDDKAKQKALKTVSTLQGIDFISMDMKEKKMTVIGTVDPVSVVTKLRKYWQTNILTVGPAKESEPPAKKDEEPKKELEAATAKQEDPPKDEEPKKEEKEEQKPTFEEPKMEQGNEKQNDQEEEEGKKLQVPPQPDPVLEMVRAYRAYNPQINTYYNAQSMEDNPNACLIS